MAYIGQTLTEGTRRVYTYTATASQSTFNAVYEVGAVDVHQNGILLQPADYTASTGTTIVLGTAAALNDEITITCHNTFSVADAVSSSQGGTFAGAVTAANGLTVDDDGATVLTVDRATNDGTVIDVQKDGASVGSIGTSGGDLLIHSTAASHGGLRFGEGYVFPVTNSGATSDGGFDLGLSVGRFKDLYLSGGVYLGGTGAANKLEDYETGDWNPRLQSGYTGSITYYTADGATTGKYIKIGNLVYIQCHLSGLTISGGSATQSVVVGGLPFTTLSYQAMGHWIYTGFSNMGTGYTPIVRTQQNATAMYIQRFKDGSSTSMQYQHFGGTLNIMITGTYYTNS